MFLPVRVMVMTGDYSMWKEESIGAQGLDFGGSNLS